MLSRLRARVQSLVRELRSHKSRSVAPKIIIIIKTNVETVKDSCGTCGNSWSGLSRWVPCGEDPGWHNEQDGLLLQLERGINIFRLRVGWGQEVFYYPTDSLKQLFTDF